MDTHSFRILQLLLEEHRYVTYEYLSHELSVSTRTIKRVMRNVQDYLDENGITYNVQMGKGIKLILTEDARADHKQNLQDVSIEFVTADERSIIILCELFKADDYMKTYYFASTLKVSVGTIERDLENVEDWLMRHNLLLERSRGKGIAIRGHEINIRLGIVNLIAQNIQLETINYHSLTLIAEDNFKDKLTYRTRKSLRELIDLRVVTQMKSFVEDYDPNIKMSLVDEAYFKFILLLSLTVDRNDKNRVAGHAPAEHDRQSKQFRYIAALFEAIEQHFHLKMSEDEQDAILGFFLSARRQGNENLPNLPKTKWNKYDQDVSKIATQIVNNIEAELNVNFNYQSDLHQRLISHLKLFLNRYTLNIKGTNHYLATIKREYTNVFEAVKRSLKKMSDIITHPVPDDEIGYITMHVVATLMEMQNTSARRKIAVVCMSGIGTSKILVESIKQKFNHVDVLNPMTVNELDELKLIAEGVDLLVSSVKIETDLLPTVIVKPFLSAKDEVKLAKLLGSATKTPHHQKSRKHNKQLNEEALKKEHFLGYLKTVYQLIDEFYFEENAPITSIDQLISYVAQQLGDSPDQTERLRAKLTEREKMGSTVIDRKGVMLLHCRVDQKLKLGVLRLKKSFTYNGADTDELISTVFIMIAPEKRKKSVIDLFSAISTELVQNERFLDTVTAGDEQVVTRHIGNVLLQVIY